LQTADLEPRYGEHDLYPFVIAPPVVKKLSFVHDLIQGRV
jgi:hypothetical protein